MRGAFQNHVNVGNYDMIGQYLKTTIICDWNTLVVMDNVAKQNGGSLSSGILVSTSLLLTL